jgi:trimeric autotransporter adhesin
MASNSGFGVYGLSNTGYAAYLDGKVFIRGPLEKPAGSFKIDHPLDPENKYLYHSFVESPDMKNIYDGVVALDNNGEAEIELPDWFGALNKEFRIS